MSTKLRTKRSLFSRIILRLCLPLLFLGIAFSAVQLGNQISILNELHQMSSQVAINAVLTAADFKLKRTGTLKATPDLKDKFNHLSRIHNIQSIHVYDVLNRSVLFSTNDDSWSGQDAKAMNKALQRFSQEKKHYIRVDRDTKQLIAYIPAKAPSSSNIYIIKTSFSLSNVKDALKTSQTTLVSIIIFVLLAGFFIAYSLSRSIVRPITDLYKATQAIQEGKLGDHVLIKTGDEIQALAEAFNHMSDNLKEMKESAQDSNPLTGLPGNQGIFNALQHKIESHQKFVFFHVDLDRFKLFNDHFGLAQGDKAIKQTADVLRKAVKEMGRSSDFIGHQGGDDFALIAHPDYAEKLGQYVCELFHEQVVKDLYPKEDFERGFTMQLDRRRLAETGEEHKCEFPLMAISLAGISNKDKDIPDYFQCMNAAVAAKKEAKSIIENSCIIKPYVPQH